MSFGQPGRFYEKDGRNYPSVTTILGVINKPALVGWAGRVEREAAIATFKAMVDDSRDDPMALSAGALAEFERRLEGMKAAQKAAEEAASIGKAVHAAVEAHLKGLPVPEFGRPEEENAFSSYLAWFRESDVSEVECEGVIYSDENRFAGRFDFKARVNGIRGVWDVKTSGAVYPEYDLQIGGYWGGSVEMGDDLTQGGILRIPKAEGDAFQVKTYEMNDLTRNYMAFLHAANLWKCLNPTWESGPKKRTKKA